MDKIQKLLASLRKKEQEAMLLLLEQLRMDYRKIPGLAAIKGMKGWFRVRLGKYRIIFFVDPASGAVEVRRVTKRNESTYKRLG